MIQRLLFQWLKVPPEPEVPLGALEVQTFRAGRNFYTYQRVRWFVQQLSALVGLYLGTRFFVEQVPEQLRTIVYVLEMMGWAGFIAQLPFTWMIRRLDFEYRWYIVTDRSLRVREGVTTIREKTMTFANIQNMTVKQGPIQRLLEIADLEIRTAGGGGREKNEKKHGEDLHLAYFRGVDNAPEIRDLIRDRVRLHRDSGLGDPDEDGAVRDEALTAADAAREVLEEVRRLRQALGER